MLKFRRSTMSVVAFATAALLMGSNMASATPPPPTGDGLHAVVPVRVLDTRIGVPHAPLAAGQSVDVTIPDLPVGTTAVAVNVTVINGTANSYLSLYAKGTDEPPTSSLNWNDKRAQANAAIVAVNPDGVLTVKNHRGTVDVIVDLVGYFAPFTPLVGPMGPMGPVGLPGPMGTPGPMGLIGETGLQGDDGPVGPAGPPGTDGVVGPVGPAGPDGKIGPAGPTGETGVAGPIGETGAQGDTGASGKTGATGPAGPAGPAGGSDSTGYIQAINNNPQMIANGQDVSFQTVTSSSSITLSGGRNFIPDNSGLYQVSFQLTSSDMINQGNQVFNLQVNGTASAFSFLGSSNYNGGTETITGTALMQFTAGDILSLHNTGSSGLMELYANGQVDASMTIVRIATGMPPS